LKIVENIDHRIAYLSSLIYDPVTVDRVADLVAFQLAASISPPNSQVIHNLAYQLVIQRRSVLASEAYATPFIWKYQSYFFGGLPSLYPGIFAVTHTSSTLGLAITH